nr:MAG TPA: hypothetical protein [Caudoviricetes sp.]
MYYTLLFHKHFNKCYLKLHLKCFFMFQAFHYKWLIQFKLKILNCLAKHYNPEYTPA